jgi:hypothetical protein
MQLAGGELSNRLRRSGAANAHAGVALRIHNLQLNGGPGLHVRVFFGATFVSDELRPAVSFAINKSTSQVRVSYDPLFSAEKAVTVGAYPAPGRRHLGHGQL